VERPFFKRERDRDEPWEQVRPAGEKDKGR